MSSTISTGLKTLQESAYKELDRAINCDEAGHRTKAIGHYKKGITTYRNTIRQYSDESTLLPREVRIIEKCKKNLILAENRLGDLETKFTTSNLMPSAVSRPVTPAQTSHVVPTAIPRSRTKYKPPRPKPPKTKSPARGPTLDYTGLDKPLVKKMLDELVLLRSSNSDSFDSISGNNLAKKTLQETIILPALRPEIFTGLRAPPKGILLFGPPGCGKTLLARALAAETKCTFFNISASSLTSKWVGEGEKLVKTLFNLARQLAPTIIFMDEIDSILTERKSNENESSRRLKTEFMLQFDGMLSSADDKLLVLGATNRPQELDDAVLRRFPKRIYITLPDSKARTDLLTHLLKEQKLGFTVNSTEFNKIVTMTQGYSGSDLAQLAKEAALEPIRNIPADKITTIDVKKIPAISIEHFKFAVQRIKPSVNVKGLKETEKWNAQYGGSTENRVVL